MTRTDKPRRPLPARTELHVRRAPVRAKSFNPDTGAFTAVIATNTPVQRGDYFEVLSMASKSIRLDRLKSGAAPVLDSHRSGSARDQIGVVIDARIENGELVAEARLSPRDDVKPIATDLAAGIAPNVSVGYRVYASVESRDKNANLIITHTDWEPYEMSLVAIPADPNAHVRNLKGPFMKKNASNTSQTIDDNDPASTNGNDAVVANNTRSADDSRVPTMSAREVRDAHELAERHNIPTDFVRQHIDSGGTMADFRERALERLADNANRTRTNSARTDETFENPDFLSRSIADALYSKMTGRAPTGAAVELAGRSMLEMGAMILQSRGERVSWANRITLADRVLTRSGSHTTSDFPYLLSSAGNRVSADAYRIAQTPLKSLARRRTVTDFRPVSTLRLSEAPRLEKVLQSGERRCPDRC